MTRGAICSLSFIIAKPTTEGQSSILIVIRRGIGDRSFTVEKICQELLVDVTYRRKVVDDGS